MLLEAMHDSKNNSWNGVRKQNSIWVSKLLLETVFGPISIFEPYFQTRNRNRVDPNSKKEPIMEPVLVVRTGFAEELGVPFRSCQHRISCQSLQLILIFNKG